MAAPSSQYEPNADDQKRVGQILRRAVAALLITYGVVSVSFLQWTDWLPLVVLSASASCLLGALALIPRGYVTASGLIVVGSVLAAATLLATLGQGIHDIGITAFPAIIVIASLILPYRAFALSTLLSVLCVAWLVFGGMLGLYTPNPGGDPIVNDFIIVSAILAVTFVAANLLTHNMRDSLHMARQENERRQIVEARLRHQSTHDALTGIYNRMHFEAELSRMQQDSEFPVSIIVADVDNLKAVNDTQGHALGDEVLRRATVILRSAFRARDVLARIGGDEFAVLLPQTDAATASQIMERVENERVAFNRRAHDLPVHFSLGVATAVQGKLDETLVIADQRMYANKIEHHTNRATLTTSDASHAS